MATYVIGRRVSWQDRGWTLEERPRGAGDLGDEVGSLVDGPAHQVESPEH
ncbi:MAG: hypothetical protein ACR2KG_08200 [Nocardioidaceae bacterium]